MNFGQALEELKKNGRVTRVGWNGKDMWLILVAHDDYEVEAYMKFNADRQLPWIGMKTADGAFVPWLASQTDMLAEDWKSFG